MDILAYLKSIPDLAIACGLSFVFRQTQGQTLIINFSGNGAVAGRLGMVH